MITVLETGFPVAGGVATQSGTVWFHFRCAKIEVNPPGAERRDMLKKPAFGEARHPADRHDQMVDDSNINELQRVAQSLSDQLIRCAGLCGSVVRPR